MEPRISLIALGVSDLRRSVRFYQDGLKLPLRQSTDEIAFFQTAGAWLELFPRELLAKDAGVPSEGSGFRGFTLAHNVRTRADVDLVMAEAGAAGASIAKAAEDKDWGGYSGYFADPDSFLWEVAWNPHFWVE